MATGRIFPSADRLDVDSSFRASKTVSKSNAFSRFSARSSSRINETTLSSDDRPRSTGRAVTRSLSSDPFDGTRKDVLFNLPGKGLKMTGMESVQRERGRLKEDNPRPLKRAVSPNIPSVDNSGQVFTVKGELVRGRRGPAQYPEQQVDIRYQQQTNEAAKLCERARSSERFRNTPHTNTSHVIVPEKMTSASQQNVSSSRFSRRQHVPTLVGVLHPVEERRAPAYRVRAPFYTDD